MCVFFAQATALGGARVSTQRKRKSPESSSNEDDNELSDGTKEDLLSAFPARHEARTKAHENLQHNAKKMQEAVARRQGGVMHLEVGTVIQIAKPEVDLCKLDDKNLTAVVVDRHEVGAAAKKRAGSGEITGGGFTYKIATKAGVSKEKVQRSYIQPLTIEPSEAGLEGVLESYEAGELAEVAFRTLVRHDSGGGEPVPRCNCKGDCSTRLCTCVKKGFKCGSACHPHKGARQACKACVNVD